jgi:hypothetical protein
MYYTISSVGRHLWYSRMTSYVDYTEYYFILFVVLIDVLKYEARISCTACIRMWLAREPGAGSGERGAGIKRAGSRDCHKKSRNR